ncbi:MAG: ABC transporter substrate-binding protein [Bdellovibrionota bacterium]
MRKSLLPLLISALTLSSCQSKNEVWVYTSLYKEVIAEMEPMLRAAFPEVDVKFFQGGSENVAAKLNTELAAGHTKADLILTSDPFWYFELKQGGKLLAYDSPAARAVPAAFSDPDHAFVTVRIPVMVIGYNGEAFRDPSSLPKSWKDLPAQKGKVSIGSPLESGTTFTAVALLQKQYGWLFFKQLRDQDLISAGGNNSVINRIETKERPIGIVLLENILKARSKGSTVRPIYPNDGAVLVPSPIAILKESKNPELAKKIYDWFFSTEAQNAIVKSGMYSPLPQIAPPAGAKAWAEFRKMPWSPQLGSEIFSQREQIKTKYSEVVLH